MGSNSRLGMVIQWLSTIYIIIESQFPHQCLWVVLKDFVQCLVKSRCPVYIPGCPALPAWLFFFPEIGLLGFFFLICRSNTCSLWQNAGQAHTRNQGPIILPPDVTIVIISRSPSFSCADIFHITESTCSLIFASWFFSLTVFHKYLLISLKSLKTVLKAVHSIHD